MGIKSKVRDDISHVMFQGNYEMIFRVLHESRTIESLKIQIGSEIKARSDEELEKNIQKLPWAAFLPIQDLYKYNQPAVISKSYRSNLFHENLIKNIVEKQINLLMVRKEYKKLNQISGQQISNRSLNKSINQQKKLIEEKKSIIIQNRELQKQSSENSQLSNIPSLPDINVYLVKDRATILMKVHLDSLHKHGLKEKVGWAPIKEGIVAGSLIQMNYKQKFQTQLKVWDPFCGSGSIVLELLSMMFQSKIRNKFDFFYLKNFPQEQYQKYLENDSSQTNQQQQQGDSLDLNQNSEYQDNQHKESQVQFLGQGIQNISIIASDISNQAIQYSLQNFHQSQLEDIITNFINSRQTNGDNQDIQVRDLGKNQDQLSQQDQITDSIQDQITKQVHSSEEKLNQLAPFYIKEQFCEDRVKFIRSDFEAISKLINLKGYTIITNLPYGLRSSEHISDKELVSSFKRFAKVIRKNLNKLQDVYVYTTIHERYHKDHFINISRMVWNIKQKYSLGGLQIGLFELNKEASLTSENYQVLDEQKLEEEEKRLAIVQSKLNKSTQDDEISKQLRQIIGDRSSLALMTPQEIKEHNIQKEYKENIQNLKKASTFLPDIKQSLDKKSHTPRQIKSILNRKKEEFAKALRLRSLIQKSKFVENLNEKEIQRRIESKRNRVNTNFIKSVLQSADVEDKEEVLQQIQEKLDTVTKKKIEKKEIKKSKLENKQKIPRWY
ncbi:hypothetical protein ABPG72_019573 [Tetrahymena utriculariae]